MQILPVLAHGLESAKIQESQLATIDMFQRATIKRLQQLPPCTSNAASYLLTGVLPFQAHIHKLVLTTFRNFVSQPASLECQVMKRQLVMADAASNSWATTIKTLCSQYDLPSPHDITTSVPTKEAWKTKVKAAVNQYHLRKLLQEIKALPSARFINVETCSFGKTHHIWPMAGSNINEVTKATIKAKFSTGTYILNTKSTNFSKHRTSPLCSFCGVEAETRLHAIVKCTTFSSIRQTYLQKLLTPPVTDHINITLPLQNPVSYS